MADSLFSDARVSVKQEAHHDWVVRVDGEEQFVSTSEERATAYAHGYADALTKAASE